MSAKLDIIVVGATGYTGRITCKYLHSIKERAGRWGIAGRNAAKLEELKKELNADVPTFVVDVTKPETLDAVCEKTICVLSCAGPFTTVGMPVVEACVRNGTHYVDSTGETNFVRLVANRFHEEAKRKGVVMVSCCGFGSVLPDMGNYVVQREAKEAVKSVRCYYDFVNAGVSNGTANSSGVALEHMEKEDALPTSLVPKDAIQPRATPTLLVPWYYPDDGKFAAPIVFSSTNERVVRRSNALRGSSASYCEMREGTVVQVLCWAVAFYLNLLVFAVAPLRRFVLGRLFPAENTVGPSEENKKASYYKLTFIAHTESGKRVVTVLSDNTDMYDCSAVFLGESALSAVALSKRKEIKGGVLTPSTAFGDELVRRCRDAGMAISTTIEDGAAPAESKKDA